MKRILFLIFLLIQFITPAKAQKESTHFSQLLASVINTYKEVSKHKTDNYFTILNNTAEIILTDQNPYYSLALAEKIKVLKVSEEKALTIIFNEIYDSLRNNYLWASVEGVSASNKQMFDIYNERLCPCISAKTTIQSSMEELGEVQKKCIADAVTDTSFLFTIKKIAGGNTVNNMFDVQRYLFLYMYEKCDIIYHNFNQVIFDNAVLGQYEKSVSLRRKTEILDVLNLYEKKNFAALKKIFPSYNQFKGLILEGIKAKNDTKNQNRAYYSARSATENPRAMLDIHNEKLLGLQLDFIYSSHALNATINKMEVKRFSDKDSIVEDQIIEIREDVVVPIKKSN